MSLNIADLHSLLYGYDMFESVTPLSLHPLDRVTIHRIRIVPLEIGAAIGAGDVAGKYFHIEFFPAINRAEIWSAQAWRESLTRHLKLKDKQRAADPLYSLQSRLTIIESRIVFHLFSTVASRGRAPRPSRKPSRALEIPTIYQPSNSSARRPTSSTTSQPSAASFKSSRRRSPRITL